MPTTVTSRTRLALLPLSLLALSVGSARAAEVRIAVAANFTAAASEIARAFEAAAGNRVLLVSGSTGKHFAQIRSGAPFDLLLGADVERPRRLEEDGPGIVGSRFTYARGRLVLWSPRAGFVDPEGSILARGGFRHLAIANPRLAPYGAAARQVLESLELWDELEHKIARGENVAQALHFVASGNAELGFLAASQITPEQNRQGSFWVVPEALHSPIEQQAVMVRDSAAARDFLDFLRGDLAREIIRAHGYEAP
jgi:molybdate transport system substrate-binding protein